MQLDIVTKTQSVRFLERGIHWGRLFGDVSYFQMTTTLCLSWSSWHNENKTWYFPCLTVEYVHVPQMTGFF